MIISNPQQFAENFRNAEIRRDAVPKGVFMVEPVDFCVDTQSSSDNRYTQVDAPVDAERARRQARRLARLISRRGIPLIRFSGRTDTPDAVFPNNVFATIPGRAIVGSMRHANRRREAQRDDIRAFFTRVLGYELVDLSVQDCIAELTGPLIVDRGRGFGFCGMSDRVDAAGAELMDQAFDLEATLCFALLAEEYHTNVVMSILGSRALVLYPDALADPTTAEWLAQLYPRHLLLDRNEVEAFAGNCIALTETDLFMSERGADALRPSSRACLQGWGYRIHASPMDEIEKAGGSVRCMVGEIF